MNSATSRLLQRKVSEIGNLPAMPTILQSLGECLSQSASSVNVDRIVELISYDKSLAAQCLRMANSALFRRRAPVDSLRGAVLALGMWRVRDIVYSCTLPAAMPRSKKGMAPATFWRHALATALVSQHLAQSLRIEPVEKFYLAGLLHDIGILVNALLFPDEFQKALAQAESSETPLWEVEQQVLGFTHCESGRILADVWNLPADIAAAVEFHHAPASDAEYVEISSTIHLADLLCRLRGLGYGYYEARAFDLPSEEAWRVLQKGHGAAAAELDLARFTFELDEHAVRIQELVDSIFAPEAVRV